MSVERITTILRVESIEHQLDFWIERLGFAKIAEVPHGDSLGFVILARGEVQLMLQSDASVAEDLPAFARESFRSFLYFEVSDLDAVKHRLSDWPIVVPERRTFYGMREIGVRDPSGNAVLLAQQAAS